MIKWFCRFEELKLEKKEYFKRWRDLAALDRDLDGSLIDRESGPKLSDYRRLNTDSICDWYMQRTKHRDSVNQLNFLYKQLHTDLKKLNENIDECHNLFQTAII